MKVDVQEIKENLIDLFESLEHEAPPARLQYSKPFEIVNDFFNYVLEGESPKMAKTIMISDSDLEVEYYGGVEE